MKIFKHWDQLTSARPVVLATGCFDGLHLGHRAVIAEALAQAKALDAEVWVMSFSPHPKIFFSGHPVPFIDTARVRVEKLTELGVAGLLLLPFNQEIAELSPADFVRELSARIPKFKALVCGYDWSFGARAQGDVAFLKTELAPTPVTAVARVNVDGARVSSSVIRHLVQQGAVTQANRLLGANWMVTGEVVVGRQVGRTLGFPTVNVLQETDLWASDGIYAGWVRVKEARYAAAIYVGKRRTFDESARVLEAYLLDFDGELYGETVWVEFCDFVRKDQVFENVEQLCAQIDLDVKKIERILHHG